MDNIGARFITMAIKYMKKREKIILKHTHKSINVIMIYLMYCLVVVVASINTRKWLYGMDFKNF